MRLVEQMRGFVLLKMQPGTHLTLLVTSFIVLYNSPFERIEDQIVAYGASRCLILLRWAHFLKIVALLLNIGDKLDFGLIIKFVDILHVFFYVGCVIYTMDYLGLIRSVNSENLQEDIVLWLTIEIGMFFYQVYSASMYLFYKQVKGICGDGNEDNTFTRHNYDILDFYRHEINWFT